MKHTLFVLAFLGLMAGVAFADESNDAICHVYVDVDANIGVMPVFSSVDLGSIQTGTFIGMIPFRVDANTQKVRMSAAASYLYKGDDPDTVWVPPILLFLDELEPGVDIVPHNGNPVAGGDYRAMYLGDVDVGGFPGKNTEEIVFESAQNNHFSQQVDLFVTWIQDDPEKPMGEYSGNVQLFCWVVLPQ
jgi:hypothetical protein